VLRSAAPCARDARFLTACRTRVFGRHGSGPHIELFLRQHSAWNIPGSRARELSRNFAATKRLSAALDHVTFDRGRLMELLHDSPEAVGRQLVAAFTRVRLGYAIRNETERRFVLRTCLPPVLSRESPRSLRLPCGFRPTPATSACVAPRGGALKAARGAQYYLRWFCAPGSVFRQIGIRSSAKELRLRIDTLPAGCSSWPSTASLPSR